MFPQGAAYMASRARRRAVWSSRLSRLSYAQKEV